MNRYGANKNLRNMRSGVNFIRNVAAPKIQKTQQTQSSKYISNQYNYPSNTSTLIITLLLHDNENPRNLIFSFNSSTKVTELINFLKKHANEEFIYFNSGNLHVDYFLTLPHRLVKELPTTRLKLIGHPIVEHPTHSLKIF